MTLDLSHCCAYRGRHAREAGFGARLGVHGVHFLDQARTLRREVLRLGFQEEKTQEKRG
jgi:hypothetical protein